MQENRPSVNEKFSAAGRFSTGIYFDNILVKKEVNMKSGSYRNSLKQFWKKNIIDIIAFGIVLTLLVNIVKVFAEN